MNAGAHTDGGLSAVPLLNAVFCADCETISNSPHDACTVCGSRSLINLFRMLGGTVRSQKPQSAEDHAKTAEYNLELTVKVHEIPANEVNRVIESISRLGVRRSGIPPHQRGICFRHPSCAQSGLNLSNPPVANAITVLVPSSAGLLLLPRPYLRPPRPLCGRDSLSARCRYYALGFRGSTLPLCPSRFLREAHPLASRCRERVLRFGGFTHAAHLAKNRKSRINMTKLTHQIRSHRLQLRHKAH